MSDRSAGTLRTPSKVLMTTKGTAAKITVTIGAAFPRPNQIPVRSAHTRDGIARPTTTKSWKKFSADRETPIRSPSGTPIRKATRSPVPRRPRLIPNASQTVVRARVSPSTSLHMNPTTLAGVGMRRVGSSGTRNCQMRKKVRTEAIRANRGVARNRRTRGRVVPPADSAPEVTRVSCRTGRLADSRHHHFLAPAEEPPHPRLQQPLLQEEGEGEEEEDPRQHPGHVEELELPPHHEADPGRAPEELSERGDLPGDRERVPGRGEQVRSQEGDDDVPQTATFADPEGARHVAELLGQCLHALRHVDGDEREGGDDDRNDRPEWAEPEDHRRNEREDEPGRRQHQHHPVAEEAVPPPAPHGDPDDGAEHEGDRVPDRDLPDRGAEVDEEQAGVDDLPHLAEEGEWGGEQWRRDDPARGPGPERQEEHVCGDPRDPAGAQARTSRGAALPGGAGGTHVRLSSMRRLRGLGRSHLREVARSRGGCSGAGPAPPARPRSRPERYGSITSNRGVAASSAIQP